MVTSRDFWEASCAGKHGYPTKDAARWAIDRLRWKNKVRGKLEVYKCVYCGSFHIGHRIKRSRRANPPVSS